MSRTAVLRVVLGQINPLVGDVDGNVEKITSVFEQARQWAADVVVVPELAVPGYPPDDLLLRLSFLKANAQAIQTLAGHSAGLTAVVGFADRNRDLYNAAAVLHDGRLVAVYHKWFLPNYSVFDEERYFEAGDDALVVEHPRARIGISICEDVWRPDGPARLQALAGADVLINISASPYHQGKSTDRRRMLSTRAADNRAFMVFCNMVGAQDELVFDGCSMVIDPSGEVLAHGAAFSEDVFAVDLVPDAAFRWRLMDPRHRHMARPAAFDGPVMGHGMVRTVTLDGRTSNETASTAATATETTATERPDLPDREPPTLLEGPEEVYTALTFATRDYARKNGFTSAVVGLSGGIDSSLTASIAVDALGPENVLGVGMPTRFSSDGSVNDARTLADNMDMRFLLLPIDDVYQAYLDALAGQFEGTESGVTEENVQPRIRGNILMALSNKFGHLVLTTGNKSETSVGFVTLYGDTAGGFAPLKDVFKTYVYELAEWRNAQADGEWIPRASIEKPPSPELKANQTDQDVLPPYAVLDPVLRAYVEEERSIAEIVDMGFDPDMVRWVVGRVDDAEYKRRQSPPGVRITERAFGRDRRMPITNAENP